MARAEAQGETTVGAGVGEVGVGEEWVEEGADLRKGLASEEQTLALASREIGSFGVI